MNRDSVPTERLAALRRAFDEGFAAPPQAPEESIESLLLIRVGGEALALRSVHITGLARIGRILPVPSRVPELLGIAGIRGALAPVFDLAALLGFPRGVAQPRWLALTRGETPAALALDQVEGQIKVARAALYGDQASPTRTYIREVARIGSALRAVADIPAVLEAISRRTGLIGPDRELAIQGVKTKE